MKTNLRLVTVVAAFVFLTTATAASAGFVYANGTDFYLNEKPFYFSGTNNYYLWYGDRHCVGYDPDGGCAREVFDDAARMNMTVIRAWGFADGSGLYWGALQPSRATYDETNFRKLDLMIKEASDRDIRLIIPLVNNWNEYGGMCKYNSWCNISGTCNPLADNSGTHDQFYTNICTRQTYKDYVSYVLNRVNYYTGVKYKDDPTILAWELANEPVANSDHTGAILDAWIGEMSAHIKSIDPNHMVGTGMEGFYLNNTGGAVYDSTHAWMYNGTKGTDFVNNHNHTSIDFTSFHMYPNYWSLNKDQSLAWMEEHIDDSEALGKPVLMGEFGKPEPYTDEYFTAWYAKAQEGGLDGSLFWMLKNSEYAWDEENLAVDCPEEAPTCGIVSGESNYWRGYNQALSPSNNAPQMAAISPITVTAGSPVVITASATDSDSDYIFYSIDDAYRFDKSGTAFTWNTMATDAGSYVFTIKASDGIAWATRQVSVTVLAGPACRRMPLL